jgi:tetratricopeptide (TPR) repeat protein
MLELDDGNGDALGISAEAAFAAAIDLGLDAPARIGRGKQQLATALAAGLTGPALDRAQALQGIATRQPDRAIAKLTGLVARSPKDGLLKLYLGWAYHTKGNDEEAIKAYDQALLASPALKVPILYARGQAKLARVDLAGARADFAAVLETAKDHVGAQVGLAAALPATQATQREADLLAILHRADVDKVDPRAIGLAWVLAGDEARRGGRLDTARGRYREALKKAPTDGLATAGLAEVELRDGKIDAAAELITKALTQTPDEIHAQLVAAEIEGRQKKYEAAEARLTALDGHQPALGPIDAARVKMIRGEVAEVQDKLDAALTAYTESAQLAGEIDLTPTMAAVKLLGKMADAAQAANPAHATELRDRAGQLLGKLAERAETEPALALTLGLAYMQAGDDAKAEQWTRKATVARPNDLEAQYQLAKTLRKLGRGDEALDVLRRAAKADPSRLDLGLDLARAYEDAKRDADAEALYTTLLNSPNVTVEIRGRAGRFAARRGKFADAGKQGEEILKLEPSGNAVGFYLRGEGLLAAGHVEEARKAFQQAVDLDPDPQYYDGQGRAAETLALAGDTKLQDNALIAYKAAIDALEAAKAPAMFNPLAGRGRIYLVRGEAEKALPPLLAANKLKPDDAEVLYGIGLAYQKIGQAKVAVEWLVRSTQVAPSADASYLLGTLYYDLNEAGPAAAALTTATRLGAELAAAKKPVPWLTDALYLLGRIEYDLHDEAAARRAWELFLSQNPSNQTRIQEVKYQLSTGLRGR